MRTAFLPIWLATGVLALLIPRLLPDVYFMHLVNKVCIAVVLALSLHVATGLGGQISLGHAAFYGIGAYASALLALKLAVPFWLALPMAGIIAAMFGLLVAIPAVRIRGHYLALVTIGFGQIVSLLLLNLAWLTNGWNGLANIPPPWFANLALDSDHTYYYVALAVAVGVIVFTRRLQRSTLGCGLATLRDDELAASSIGINPIYFKLFAFGLSAAYAGIAGSLHAHLIHFISPEEFTIDTSIAMLTMIVLGGMGSLPGAIVGGAVMTLLPEWLRFLELYRKLLYGVVIILIMVFLPRGLISVGPRLIRLARRLGIQGSLHTEGISGA